MRLLTAHEAREIADRLLELRYLTGSERESLERIRRDEMLLEEVEPRLMEIALNNGVSI